MLDCTDRHCRTFHRLITRHTRLYTEMVTTGALLHGDAPRHLDYDAAEHPLALQLGGSEPDELAACARLALRWGYDEVNLNCGCPSERVQRGAFGACLMNEAALVRDGVKAMLDAVGGAVPVTVKHRIGIDRCESYEFMRDFVGTVAQAGCTVFIVHARNAWLKGLRSLEPDASGAAPGTAASAVHQAVRALSPKDNREIPPLRYELVHRLKREFPALTIVINGGFTRNAAIAEQWSVLDGVMVGRQAYHEPAIMAAWDALLLSRHDPLANTPSMALDADPGDDWRIRVEDGMVAYLSGLGQVSWSHASRHMLGLWNGRSGARRWRQVWSDHRLKSQPPAQVQRLATAARLQGGGQRQPATAPSHASALIHIE